MSGPTLPTGTTKPKPRRWLYVCGLLAMGLLFVIWQRSGRTPPAPPTVPGEELTATDREIKVAIDAARAVVLHEPRSGIAWGNLGQLFHVHNYLVEAMACYAEAERYDPRNPDWPYFRATIQLVGSEPGSAIPDLQRAVDLAGSQELPRLRLSEVLLDQGRFDDAAERLRSVLATNPSSPRANLRMAQVAVARQDWRATLQHLEVIDNDRNARKLACSLRIIAYRELGSSQDALRQQELFNQYPEDLPWHDETLAKLSKFQLGMKARLDRAKAMWIQGDKPGVMALLTQTVCDYPNSEATWAAFGVVLENVGDYPTAEDFLLKSAELAPGAAYVWLSLGDVRVKQQKWVGALACYREAIQLKPADADGHLKLGECLEATGDRSGAGDAYRQALRYRPNFPEARERLEKLQVRP